MALPDMIDKECWPTNGILGLVISVGLTKTELARMEGGEYLFDFNFDGPPGETPGILEGLLIFLSMKGNRST